MINSKKYYWYMLMKKPVMLLLLFFVLTSSIQIGAVQNTRPADYVIRKNGQDGLSNPPVTGNIRSDNASIVTQWIEYITAGFEAYEAEWNFIEKNIPETIGGEQGVSAIIQNKTSGQFDTIGAYYAVSRECDPGYKHVVGNAGFCEPISEDMQNMCLANPIIPQNGEKIEIQTDYRGTYPDPIVIKRYYHSLEYSTEYKVPLVTSGPFTGESSQPGGAVSEGYMGQHWDHGYSSRIYGHLNEYFGYVIGENPFAYPLEKLYDNNPEYLSITATLFRPNGTEYTFTNIYDPYNDCHENTEWASTIPGAAGKLEDVDRCSSTTDLLYTREDNVVERYDINGRLISITYPSGISHTVTRDPATFKILSIVHSMGEALIFNYDPATHLLTSITDNNNRSWTYRYDSDQNLEFVDYPDGTTAQYHYDNLSFLHALTGITDRRGLRYSHFEYGLDPILETEVVLRSYHGDDPLEKIDWVEIDYYNTGSNFYNRLLTNSLGETTNYKYSNFNGYTMLSEINGKGCSECGEKGFIQYSYHLDSNNLFWVKDNGITSYYDSYDADNQLTTFREATSTPLLTRQTRYTYDSRFRNQISTITKPSVVAGKEKVTTITYDDNINITSITVAQKDQGAPPSDPGTILRSQTFKYEGPFNQLSEMDGPRDNLTDADDRTYISYYAVDDPVVANRGRRKSIVGPLGIRLVDNIQWTATGKMKSFINDNNLEVSLAYYNGNDRLENMVEKDTTTNKTRTTHWAYLETGEVQSISVGYGTPDETTITFEYDAARRLKKIIDGNNNYIEYVMDTEGNILEQNIHDDTGYLKRALSQTYDSYSRLDVTSQMNQTFVNSDFNIDGTLGKSTDGNGVVDTYSYDGLRRLTQINRDTGGIFTMTQIDHDVHDNITSVYDPINPAGSIISKPTQYVYDDVGNILSITSPDTGTTVLTHDAAGNIKSMTNAKGLTFQYSYDALNRVTFIDAPSSADDITYVYDTCLNGAGLTCSISSAYNSVTYEYDAFGNVTSHQGISYSYDSADRVETITYPSGAIVTYGYDNTGKVNQVDLTRNGITTTLASNIDYMPLGPLKTLNYGNGNSLTQTYDEAYRITAQTVTSQSLGDILQLAYPQYDPVNNLLQRDDVLANGSEIFTYDGLNRIDTANDSAALGYGSLDYDYDKNSNRTQLTDNGVTTGYSYDPHTNRMKQRGSDTVVLDENGNTISVGNRSYVYNDHNRMFVSYLDGVYQGIYLYNGLGQRSNKIQQTGNQAYGYGLNGKLLVEISDTKIQEYIYLNGQLLATINEDRKPKPVVTGFHPPAALPGEHVYLFGINLRTATSVTINGIPASFTVGEPDALDVVIPSGVSSGPITVTNANGSYTTATSFPAISTELIFNGFTPGYGTEGNTVGILGQNLDPLSTTVSFNGIPAKVHFGNSYVLIVSAPYGATRVTSGKITVTSAQGDSAVSQEAYTVGDLSTLGLSYVHNDHLGTPRAMTDNAGTKIWSATYDPYGKATVNDDVDGNGVKVSLNHRFPGQYYDEETGLHYNYFRTYDPDTGRYLTSDPIGLAGGLNTFGYVTAQPLLFTDPFGLADGFTGRSYPANVERTLAIIKKINEITKQKPPQGTFEMTELLGVLEFKESESKNIIENRQAAQLTCDPENPTRGSFTNAGKEITVESPLNIPLTDIPADLTIAETVTGQVKVGKNFITLYNVEGVSTPTTKFGVTIHWPVKSIQVEPGVLTISLSPNDPDNSFMNNND